MHVHQQLFIENTAVRSFFSALKRLFVISIHKTRSINVPRMSYQTLSAFFFLSPTYMLLLPSSSCCFLLFLITTK